MDAALLWESDRDARIGGSPPSSPEGADQSSKLPAGDCQQALGHRRLGTGAWASTDTGVSAREPDTAAAVLEWRVRMELRTSVRCARAQGAGSSSARPVACRLSANPRPSSGSQVAAVP